MQLRLSDSATAADEGLLRGRERGKWLQVARNARVVTVLLCCALRWLLLLEPAGDDVGASFMTVVSASWAGL